MLFLGQAVSGTKKEKTHTHTQKQPQNGEYLRIFVGVS